MQVDPEGAEDLGEESQQLGVLRLFFQVLVFLVSVITVPSSKMWKVARAECSRACHI